MTKSFGMRIFIPPSSLKENFFLIHLDEMNYCPSCGRNTDDCFASDMHRVYCMYCDLEI